MAKQDCNAEQADTPRLIPMLPTLCLVSVVVLTLAGTVPDTQAQRLQLQNPGIQELGPTQALSQRIEPGEVPNDLSNDAWDSIQGQIAAGKYRAYKHENDGYVSSNPVHGWQIRYAADGTTTLKPRDHQAHAYHLGLKLRAVGFVELQTLDRPEQITAEDFTVTYQWNDTLREWWLNSETDLEQWFELDQRPPGAQSGQFLTLVMTLATDLAASQQGNALSFADTAGTTINYSKLQAWDASGRELPARMQLAANTLSLIIDDSDAQYPLTIDPSLEQQAYLKASNTGDRDLFGWSVAISGDTLVVGAINEDSNATGINGDQSNNSRRDSGAAYVFTRIGTAWSQQAYLKASNTNRNDTFGNSVAISGDTLVVGADTESSNATGINGDQSDNSAPQAGAAYVFTRSGTEWSQQAYLKASNSEGGDGVFIGDLFGNSVAISGDTLVVGAHHEDSNATGINGDQSDNSALASGAVYVFTRSGTEWSQQAYLKASNTDANDAFGGAVAISGDTLVVGADTEDSNATGINGDQSDNSASRSGAVYVFTRDGTDWSQQAYLKASNTDSDDEFGVSVAISGDTLVVGTNLEASNATGINGDQSDNSEGGAGAAYVFTRSGMTWSQQAYLKASNTDGDDNVFRGDAFGVSVAISGDKLVVGAHREPSNATGINGDQSDNSARGTGAAYVFTRSGTAWSQQAYVKPSNSGGAFGWSVAISGGTLVVGALGEASNATGINGDQSDNSAEGAGAAYVFNYLTDAPGFEVNAGHSGAWYNPATSGQGQLIDVVPSDQFMFVAWFTFTAAVSNNPDQQHWYTAQGNYNGNTAELILYETLGGQFDDPQEVSTNPVGTVTLSFSDCEQGQMAYSIDTDGREGTIPLERVIPGSGDVCKGQSGQATITTEAVDINAGMDGAWVNEDTLGQGFLIDAHPNEEGGNFIFVAWFTYGDETASGQRWLTAQGDFMGSTAEIEVFETTGGSFNNPQAPDTVRAGTMIIDFTDCSNAQLSYSLTVDNLASDMAISRLIPGGQALCEELAGAD